MALLTTTNLKSDLTGGNRRLITMNFDGAGVTSGHVLTGLDYVDSIAVQPITNGGTTLAVANQDSSGASRGAVMLTFPINCTGQLTIIGV